jgi:glycosyltransferase involved in cell wall biosynthesis
MFRHRPTIGLVMIVKNEAHVLDRCLASVRPLLSHWTIVDTGSSDNTRAVAENALSGIPGSWHERSWVNFAHNRTESLVLARGKTDYILIVDADDTIEVRAFPRLRADCHELVVVQGSTEFRRPHVIRSGLPWVYRSVVHEYLDCEQPFSRETLNELRYICVGGGARSRNPLKYSHDAAILEQALLADPNNARYRFYLAQSYRDAGDYPRAIDAYRARVALGGWPEEVFYSLLQIGLLLDRCGAATAEVADALLAAHEVRPSRREPLVSLASHYRRRGFFHLALLFASRALEIPKPDDRLFLDLPTYGWRADFEQAEAASALGDATIGACAAHRLVKDVMAPPRVRERARMILSSTAVGV